MMRVLNLASTALLTLGTVIAPASSASADLPALAERVGEVQIEEHSAEEYASAAKEYRALLLDLDEVDVDGKGIDDQVDLELLRAHLKTRLFEIEELELHRVVPVRYFVLSKTSSLFLRPCGYADSTVEKAAEELERLPTILDNARRNLSRPARVWTENAIYQAYYARLLLEQFVPDACVDDPGLDARLQAAASRALDAVVGFESWLREELLPRSDRSPTWTPEQVEFYQFQHEQLTDYGVDRMIEVAQADADKTLGEMRELATSIHPSGDLATVWEAMKEEAPPWQSVEPMAARYVDLTTAWLRGPGAHVVKIPDFDYGVRLTSPMGRRVLSFGGAEYGPTVAGRISGYYVLTPLEEQLTQEDAASRIRSYNPYWTHVISYHEWLGHNVQRAVAETHVTRPVRKLFRSSYLSQAWSFYLEKLLEDEGYFESLPYLEELKGRMARLQMRMWRIQRILTKLRMARGEMTFEDAVEAYVDKIGMEPTNAWIEVQRDSQSPSPPGREIVGERVILEMRDEYKRRTGEHFDLAAFHEALLKYGELPLPAVRRLMFQD